MIFSLCHPSPVETYPRTVAGLSGQPMSPPLETAPESNAARNRQLRRRVFLAIPVSVSPSAAAELSRLPKRLAEHGLQGRFSDPRQAHLTLVFLGGRTDEEIRLISESARLAASETAPFALAAGMVASFGRRPRLLFLEWREGMENPFTRLALRLREGLERTIGLDEQTRRQTPRPHTTLIRFRKPAEKAPLRSLEAEPAPDRGLWVWPSLPQPSTEIVLRCRVFCLYRSDLTGIGPVYHELERFRLSRTDSNPWKAGIVE